MGLVIADGSRPRRWGGRQTEIEWLPYIPQCQFIDTLSGSHVVHLPVRETGRSAGQMVLVASTETYVEAFASVGHATSARAHPPESTR